MKMLMMFVSLFAASTAFADSPELIRIQKATYGMKTDVDATAGVKALCEGQVSCSFKVESRQLGVADPAPGVPKSFRLTWSCGKRGMLAIETNDSDTVTLDCEKKR